MMLTKSIVLIGMPGSGKSTVGRALARKHDVDFCDTDDLIIENTGESLQDTLDRLGRDGFLEEERQALLGYTPSKPQVIATGGSVVLHDDAMQHLKSIGTVIFLDADLPLIKKRLWNIDTRGIVFNSNEDDVIGVYREREPLYYKYSDARVHIRGKRIANIIDAIDAIVEK